MSDDTSAPAAPPARKTWLNEDWTATILGLALLILILLGAIPQGLVP